MSMKLGFIGGKKPDQCEDAARLASECGYEGLEFDYWGEFEDCIDADVVDRMRKTLQSFGVGIAAYGLWGYNYLSLDDDERAHAHQVLDRAIGFAETLGAHVVVLGGGDIANEPLERKVTEFLAVFPPILKRIESAGMQAAFYAVHGESFFDSLVAYERVWAELPNAKMKYDPATWAGTGHDYLEVVRRCGNRIGHVHIKEVIYDAGGKVVSQPPAGMGEIQWGKVLAFLYEHNYDGYLSVEPHMDPWLSGEGLRKNLVLSKRHISQYLI